MSETRKSFKLGRKTASALIVDSLRERLMNHEFAESEMIRQERLAEEYSVSLSPVREALIQLETEGLLKLVRHHGYRVTTLSTHDLMQLYELRALVEVALLESAIPKLSDSDIDSARKAHEMMIKIYKGGRQTTAWTRLNWEFHASLYRAAGKEQLLAIVDRVHTRITRYVHMQLKIRKTVELERNIKEHQLLLEYCTERNTGKAAHLLRSHILQGCDDLVGFLEKTRRPQT